MAELGRRNDVDPLVSYSFVVEMEKPGSNGAPGKSSVVARFSGVDGLNYEVEMIEYRDSARPNEPMFRQGRRKPTRVTLKHGVLVGFNAENDLLTGIREGEKGTIQPRNITITIGTYGSNMVDETGSAPASWQLVGCYPAKWSLGALDGNSSSNLIESIEVVVEKMIRS